MELDHRDADALLNFAPFRRFLFAAIQSSGVLCDHNLADGLQERDLRFNEGRRSLGFEMLQAVDQGQPEPLQTPHALATLNALLLETMNHQEADNGRRSNHDRYAGISDD